MRLNRLVFAFLIGVLLLAFSPGVVLGAAISVVGKAKVLNTTNSYLDFTGYSSNVTIDSTTGNFSGYGFLEDIGWIAFGTTDNSLGPVNVSLTTGAVTGKAKALNTNAYLDFTNYNSNVTVTVATGVFAGYAFSEDVGWLDFSDTGVSSSTPLDAEAPLAFDLVSPEDNVYTTNDRPTFKWKATTDAISSMSKYVLFLDNGETGDISIDNIPASGTTDVETARFVIHFDGFSDSDATNNYISVYTRSSTLWNQDQNDGRLRPGKRNWKVTAYDTVGNTRDQSRDIFIDFGRPVFSNLAVNGQASFFVNTTDRTPEITGRLTDNLLDGIASGPGSIELKVERRNSFGLYAVYEIKTAAIGDTYWTADGTKIINNAENKSAKYADFAVSPTNSLTDGTYRLTITGRDKAGNSVSQSFGIGVGGLGEIIEELPSEEQEKIIEEGLEITVPQAEIADTISFLERIIRSITQFFVDVYWLAVDGLIYTVNLALGVGQYIANISNTAFTGLSSLGQSILDVQSSLFTFAYNLATQTLTVAADFFGTLAVNIAVLFNRATQSLAAVFVSVSDQIALLYTGIAQSAPGVLGSLLLSIGDSIGLAVERMVLAASLLIDTYTGFYADLGNTTRSLAFGTGAWLEAMAQFTGRTLGNFAAYLAGVWEQGERAIATSFTAPRQGVQRMGQWISYSAVSFGEIVLDKEPTRIYDVRAESISATSVVITWKTNHLATSKVNYGESLDYGEDVQSDDKVHDHRVEITGLTPGTKYLYEVMSKNKNYVYDSHHEFETNSE